MPLPSTSQKVLVVFGTRPEAVKLAPVVRALQACPESFVLRTCATGQHRHMLDQVLEVFGMTPDVDLNLMAPNQSLSALGARLLTAFDEVLAAEQPDWVLVQGDTTTVMMSALAAQHRLIRVGHVEAGLRTYDRRNPFPEEMNRVVTDHVADLCFAPTTAARDNLLRENISAERIVTTGNTGVDALLMVAGQPWHPPGDHQLASLPAGKQWILVTAHRRESFGQPLEEICTALHRLARERGDQIELIFPVHRNPNVLEPVNRRLANVPGITLLPPLDYRAMVYLLQNCKLVLTDSGGLQEEAPTLHKPVLVMRSTTERPEAVDAGAARLVGARAEHIVTETKRLLDDDAAYAEMVCTTNPFGDGHAAERIVAALQAAQQE